VYEHPTRWAPVKTAIPIQAEAGRAALGDASLPMQGVGARAVA
jgi:hypothetical protein